MDTFYQNAQQTGLREPTPPSREQFETDPIGYMDLKMKYDEEKAAYDQQVQEFENLRSQKLQAEQQRLDEFTQDQARLLSQRIPEIADPKKGDAIKEVGGSWNTLRFSELNSEMSEIIIHFAMYDAMRYRNLVKKRGNATSLKSIFVKQERNALQIKANDRKKAEQRFQKSGGSVESAIDLILNS